MKKNIIAVIGSSGAQGGGLARAILADPASEFSVRAITRHPDGEKARALAALGAQVVQADIDDPGSVRRAFEGAYGAFCVTNFWEHFSPERELAQARNMAEAAKAAGVAHTIWSTFEDTRKRVPLADPRMPTLQGKYKVPHFDAKGEADDFFRGTDAPTTFLATSFYWDNFIFFGMGPKQGPKGLAISLCMDDAKLPGIAAEDIGKCAYGVFRRGRDLVGRTVGIAGEHLTGDEMAARMSRALDREITYRAISPAEYRSLGFPGADDLGNMFQYKRDFNREYCASRDVAFSRALNPQLLDFSAWLDKYAQRIPLA
jgi:uncharacterized protein YbjT (DUF2867 family)